MNDPIAIPNPPGTIAQADLGPLIAAFSDVTAKLESTHDQLRAEVARLSAELSRANNELDRSRRLAALGEMAAGIAHEVRNPLGSIRLYARMLDEDLGSMPAQRETARKIDAAARGLNAIVGDVLNFSREFRLRAEPCALTDILDEAVRSCRCAGIAGAEAVEVVAPPGAPGDRVIVADRSLLSQAVTNVVRNAFEAVTEAARTDPARPRRVEFGIDERRVVTPEHADAAWTVLSVRDTGPGLSAGVIARMFNPFFTTRSSGTGLGLAIVHRIVDAHGGRVVVRDNAHQAGAGPEPGGQGATLELWLPAEPAGVAAEPPRRPMLNAA